jgi:WD40 repeat protein/tetratricopeptide (TPR) repeat protein
MTDILLSGASSLSLSLAQRIDDACNRFELAWKAGQRPRIEDALHHWPPAERAILLQELIALEMAYRRQAGEQPQSEEYRARFPELGDWSTPLLERTTADTVPGAPSAAARPIVPGYEILSELGRGGMGVVYKAWQTDLNRVVALKMIRAGDLADSRELARFHTEAEAVARLQHPHIVQIYQAGQHEGRLYLALECVDGSTLGRQLAGTPWPARRAAQLVETLARAMHHAHCQGIVHRDLTPGNVLLTHEGQPKITDFGLAKIVIGGGPTLTQTGAFLGTPSYSAPEQAAGKTREVGPLADVYALGAILYECLSGRPPFKAETPLETLRQVESQEPVALSRLQPSVPRDLSTVCLKCLQKEPRKRYASAEALAEDLGRFLAGLPVRARPMGRTERLGRWCRRNPMVASLLSTVAVLLIAVATVSTFSAARLKTALINVKTALTEKEAAERQARLREAEALVGQAHGIRYSRRPGQRFEALEALAKAAAIGRELGQPPEWFGRLRNEAIAALALPDLHITQSWDGFPPGTHGADVSPDFELYARTTAKGACSIRRIADDREIAQLPALGEPAGVTFGPGHLLVLVGGSSRRFQLWDLAEAEPVLRFNQPDVGPDWSFRSDGRLIALGHGDGALSVYETDSRVPKYRLKANGITKSPQPALHPTEPIVAASSYYSPLLQVRDLRSGAVLISLTLPWRGSGMCAWSPDGRTLAVSHGNSGLIHLYAFDPVTPGLRLLRRLEGPSNGGTTIHFNTAGDRVISGGWDGKVHLFDAVTGRLLFSTPKMLGTGSLRFDPSGERLSAARVGPQLQQIGVWSVAYAREYRPLIHSGPGHRYPECRSPAVHPSQPLAALGLDDGLALFDLETGSEVTFVPVPRGVGSVCFDGSGNLFTNGYAGLFRWPVRPDPTRPGRMTVGPPERLPFKPGNRGIATSRDGRVIAQAMWCGYDMQPYVGGWVLHPNATQAYRVDAGSSRNWASVSPDGRWVAFGAHCRVDVYEAATHRHVWQAPPDSTNDTVLFSPDGLWLATSNDGGRVYRVGTWEPGPQLGPGTPWAFSLDSRLVVLGQTDGVYRLVEFATGRELARLEDPEQIAAGAVFTPDGTRLVVAAPDGLRVWNLRRLRKALVRLGLDWDAPPYPETADVLPGPLEVRIEGAELIDPKKMAEYQRVRVLLTLLRNPFDADAHFHLGQQLLDAGHAKSAYIHMTAALAFGLDLDEARHLRARAAFRLQRWAEAAADASRYLDQHADAHSVRFLRARSYQADGRFADAVADCTELIKRYPRDPKLYRLRAACHEGLGHAAQAKADREQAFTLAPHDPSNLNRLAWGLVTGPAEQRDPAWALQLIQEAVKQRPEDGMLLNTLGVVQYRNGQYAQARVTLEKSLAAGKGQSDAFDLFFLAMCHAKLGAPAKARECFHRAVKWMDGQKNLNPRYVQELTAFQAEAQAVLGLK